MWNNYSLIFADNDKAFISTNDMQRADDFSQFLQNTLLGVLG